jgi:hypothetical protein
MNADRQMPIAPRKVHVRKGAQNASQALLDRVARSLPRWAARLARKAMRQRVRRKKPAPVADPNYIHVHYHAD